MANSSMYIPYDDTQNYPSVDYNQCSAVQWLKYFDTQQTTKPKIHMMSQEDDVVQKLCIFSQQTNKNSVKVVKVSWLSNK